MEHGSEVKVGQVWETPSKRKVMILSIDGMCAGFEYRNGQKEGAFIAVMTGKVPGFTPWKLIKDVPNSRHQITPTP